jgi:hypothetical protein
MYCHVYSSVLGTFLGFGTEEYSTVNFTEKGWIDDGVEMNQ